MRGMDMGVVGNQSIFAQSFCLTVADITIYEE